MTPDKTEAQPEALRLAARLDCDATDADMGRKPIACTRRRAAAELRRQHAEIQQLKAQLSEHKAARMAYASEFPPDADGEADVGNVHANIRALKAQLITQINRAAAAEQQVTALTQRLDMANRLNTDARNQLAQLSARQAAPDGWEPVWAVFRTRPDENGGKEFLHYAMWHNDTILSEGERYVQGHFVPGAAPPQPEREPQKHDENRELAETAMRFVDRAGDVHPGIDDADRICAEFHAAMMEVIEKWHPTPLPTKRPSPQHEPSSLKADLEQFWKSVEDGSVFDVSPEASKQLDLILKANPNAADGI